MIYKTIKTQNETLASIRARNSGNVDKKKPLVGFFNC